MPDITFGQQLGLQMAGQATSGIMGLALGDINDKRQLRQQEKLQALQIAGQKDMTNYNYGKQLEMWKNTSYPAQMEQLRLAGLNPGLIYGMSGGGGQTTGSGSGGNVTGGQAPTGGGEAQQLMQGMGMNFGLMEAQRRVLETQADKNQADADKTRGVDTANVQADTENKILQQVITKYTGMEAKDVYERIMKPNRGIQAKTHQDELEARQGIATTVYELWVEGKLKQKSLTEIEQLLLHNAKTTQETESIKKTIELLGHSIKGAELDNIIKDLEMRLQTQTGIDKGSGGLLKILGRLFVELSK